VAGGIHQAPIVFGYDGSEHAKAAIREAALQLRPGRHAIVVTVAPDLHARDVADEGAELARSVGFDAMPLVVHGDPVWRRLLDAAREVNAALLVLGAHGRTPLRLLVPIGSVAAATSRHAERPVLIVHDRSAQAA
jgi:nucleotide-binding universal stress UspA family protein